MKTMKNCPTETPRRATSLIEYEKNQVLSMALTDSRHVRISLFTFADGEMVGRESYPGDTLYHLLEGETKITLDDERSVRLNTGEFFAVAACTSHSIGGGKAFKMMQITLNS